MVSLVQLPQKKKIQKTIKKIQYDLLLIYPPPPTHLDITLKMQWIPVDVRVEQLNLNIMHRIFHGVAPCYLTDNFARVVVRCIMLLPLKIKKLNSLTSVKQVVRRHLKESSRRIQLRLSMLLVCLSCI